jgi:hypothetical protein
MRYEKEIKLQEQAERRYHDLALQKEEQNLSRK